MKRKVDWIELVRDPELMILPKRASKRLSNLKVPDMGDPNVVTDYDELWEINRGSISVPDWPCMVSPNGYVKAPKVGPYEFHSEEPAPTFRASNLSYFWGQVVQSESPSGAYQNDTKYLYHMHRESPNPAVIECIGFKSHFHWNKLHRKGMWPALSVDKLIVTWAVDNRPFRKNGPVGITINGYKEFWKDGVFKGYRMDGYDLTWGKDRDEGAIKEFLADTEESYDIFSNRFFRNPQDEMLFISEFN